jgi:predicted nucleic acid-binding protein
MRKVCLDTGVLDIYFSSHLTEPVKMLMDDVRTGNLSAFIVMPVLSEIFFHLCRQNGASEAATQLTNFLNIFPIELVEPGRELLFSAGKIRCQHASTLSYIDCMSIAFCLSSGAEFHTIEKAIKQIPQNTLARLHVVTYAW